MASKARHLRSGANYTAISIDRLFEAAFGPSPAHYRHESLMGWRPVSCAQKTLPHFGGHRQPPPAKTPANPPGIHIHESAERIVVEVQLPQIRADSLHLEISGDLLIIRGERIVERPQGGPDKNLALKGPPVHRYVQLPVVVRPGEVRARLEGNTVKVNIHKRSKSD